MAFDENGTCCARYSLASAGSLYGAANVSASPYMPVGPYFSEMKMSTASFIELTYGGHRPSSTPSIPTGLGCVAGSGGQRSPQSFPGSTKRNPSPNHCCDGSLRMIQGAKIDEWIHPPRPIA